MAKAKEPDDTLLVEPLSKLLGGEPVRQTGTPTAPGIFPGTAPAQKKLVARAVERGYLEECEGPPLAPKKGGKVPAPVLYGRITPKGREWVLRQTSPRAALEALLAAFRAQSAAFQSEDSEAKLLQAQLAALQNSFNETQRAVQDTIARRREDAARILSTVQSIAGAVQSLAGSNHAPDSRAAATMSAPPPLTLAPEALRFVRTWEKERRADCPLPALYAHLRATSTGLTIGNFHDLLRSLHEGGELRLTPWTQRPDDIRQPELALFISTAVMYYAHAATSTG